MVRCLTFKEVKDIAGALEPISEASLKRKYIPQAFQDADIYPGGDAWDETGIDTLLNVFGDVRGFFVDAARDGEMVLLSTD